MADTTYGSGSDAAAAAAAAPVAAAAAAVPAAAAAAPRKLTVTVRAATRDDMHLVHQMIHELAQFEGMPEGPELSVDDLIRDGFDSSPAWFFALIAECAATGDVVGHALCNRAYSSWTRRAFYIEDLYVQPRARRVGVGQRLLHHVCQMAMAEGVHRVDWHVLRSNAPALAFYGRLGARDLCRSEARTAMRLDRHRIEALARARPDSTTHTVTAPPPLILRH